MIIDMKEEALNRKRCNIHNKKIKIGYILSSFPGNTETFVLNEIVGLSRLGLDITIFSIHKSVTNRNLFDYKRFLSKTIYADSYFSLPMVLSHLYYLFRRPSVYLKLLLNYKAYGGKKAFWEGVYFSRVIIQLGIKHVHAHFAWKATDVARLISSLTNIPFSFTAHAREIYVTADHFKNKLKEAKFLITCVKQNKKFIVHRFGEELTDKIHVVYHGVDLEIFSPLDTAYKTVDVLSIGNFVEKKGHRYLLEACRILEKRGLSLKCLIIGEGPEKERLLDIIRNLDLGGSVEIEGKRPQAELPSVYARSKVFVLPSFIANSGDRDGIPNVLVEAMAMGLPVISSDVPNISELIEHGRDGILVREKDPESLADTIEELLNDSNKCAVIGGMARKKIEKEFNARDHIQNIAEIFMLQQTSN